MTDTLTLVTSEPSPPRKSFVSPLLVLLILAISAWIQFTVVSRTDVTHPFRSDGRDYFLYAYNLTHYGVYSEAWTLADPPQSAVPDSVRTPGYPLFLTALGDPEPTDAFVRKFTLVQAGLGVLSVLLFYFICRRFLPTGWSHLATLLAALSPHLAIISSLALSECLFVFVLFASILSLIFALQYRRGWLYLLTGLLWGTSSLVRPTTQFLPPLFLLMTLLPRYRDLLKPAAVICLGFLLVQAPWQIRNMSVPENPSQPNMTANFLNFGTYPGFMYENDPGTYGYPYRFDPEVVQIQANVKSVLIHVAKLFRDQPLKYSYWYFVGKPIFFLSWSNPDGDHDILIFPVSKNPYQDDARFRTIRMTMLLLHWPLMLLGMAGAFLVFLAPRRLGLDSRQLSSARVVAGVFCYALVFHMIGAPLPRYGIPFRPLLYPMAILILLALKAKARRAPLALSAEVII